MAVLATTIPVVSKRQFVQHSSFETRFTDVIFPFLPALLVVPYCWGIPTVQRPISSTIRSSNPPSTVHPSSHTISTNLDCFIVHCVSLEPISIGRFARHRGRRHHLPHGPPVCTRGGQCIENSAPAVNVRPATYRTRTSISTQLKRCFVPQHPHIRPCKRPKAIDFSLTLTERTSGVLVQRSSVHVHIVRHQGGRPGHFHNVFLTRGLVIFGSLTRG
jgi:hypothetical protein